jgi:hypothetical protein
MHVDLHDLGLYLKGALEDARFAEIEAHLADCPPCGAKLSDRAKVGVARGWLLNETERRRELRIRTDEAAQLQIFSPFCPDRFTARVLDVSRHGLRISFSKFLQPGTVIQVRVKPLYILGEVRYCVAAASGESAFLIGVQIQDVQGW